MGASSVMQWSEEAVSLGIVTITIISFSTSLTPFEYKIFHFADAESVMQRFYFWLMIQARRFLFQ
jgi:hypothetical protein